MNQVSMSGVNLNDAKAGFAGAPGRGHERRNNPMNAVNRERLRLWIVMGKSQRARGHDIGPASFTFGDGSISFPRSVGAGLATGVCQLHPSHAALLMNKA